jgi:hypothetical protein
VCLVWKLYYIKDLVCHRAATWCYLAIFTVFPFLWKFIWVSDYSCLWRSKALSIGQWKVHRRWKQGLLAYCCQSSNTYFLREDISIVTHPVSFSDGSELGSIS